MHPVQPSWTPTRPLNADRQFIRTQSASPPSTQPCTPSNPAGRPTRPFNEDRHTPFVRKVLVRLPHSRAPRPLQLDACSKSSRASFHRGDLAPNLYGHCSRNKILLNHHRSWSTGETLLQTITFMGPQKKCLETFTGVAPQGRPCSKPLRALWHSRHVSKPLRAVLQKGDVV